MPRRLFLLLTLIVMATILISAFQRDLFVGDETKYSQVVREMREHDSFLVPLLNGHPYTHKPPMHFWGIVLLCDLLGYQSLWPFVLQSVLGYVGLIFVTRAIARELYGSEAAPLAGFLFATSILAWGIAQTARMDATFTLFISLAVLFLARFYRTRAPRNLHLAGVMTGVAILIKGPMAFVIVALLVAFESFRRRRSGEVRTPLSAWLSAFAIVLAIPLLWLVPALQRGGKQYAHDLLIKQNIGRAVNSFVHKEPPWYYVVHAPATFFPWLAIVVIAVLAARRMEATESERDRVGFALSWIAAVIVPFSLLSGKLDVYMLPALPPAAIIAGAFLARRADDRYTRWTIVANRVTALLLLLIVLAIPIVASSHLVPPSHELDLFRPGLVLFTVASAILLLAALVMMFVGNRETLLQRSTMAMAVAALAPLIVATVTLMPQINEISSTRPLVRAIAPLPVKSSDIALFACPNLWTRDMSPALFNVRYIGDDGLDPQAAPTAQVVVTKRSRTAELGSELANYDKTATVRMIGKDFDVYRRR